MKNIIFNFVNGGITYIRNFKSIIDVYPNNYIFEKKRKLEKIPEELIKESLMTKIQDLSKEIKIINFLENIKIEHSRILSYEKEEVMGDKKIRNIFHIANKRNFILSLCFSLLSLFILFFTIFTLDVFSKFSFLKIINDLSVENKLFLTYGTLVLVIESILVIMYIYVTKYNYK